MKRESLEALGAVPARPDELPPGLLEDLAADGIMAYKIPAAPRVIHEGRYRLYEKPDGTLRIQYQRTDRDTEDFFEIPGEFIALARAAAEGKLSPADMMKAVMKMMRSR
jgi:hypothetical protein